MFHLQQIFLPLQTSCVASEGAVGTNDSVAGNDEADGIAPHGTANGLCGHVLFGEKYAL